MSDSLQNITPEQAAQLKTLLDAYNQALRALPLMSFSTVFFSGMLGRPIARTLDKIHPTLPLIFIAGIIVFIIYVLKREKMRRKKLGIRTPWELKREMKSNFGVSPNQARAILARVNGPTVLDRLTEDNTKDAKFSLY